jgi:UDPglucose 6-dehydrogenase
MNIAVYGAGYVGLVSSVCLAEIGHSVICVDVSAKRVEMLSNGECPIYEERLPAMLNEQISALRLSFTVDLAEAAQTADVHIIATGTPGLDDGSADLSQVFTVVTSLLNHVDKSGLIVTKSTVPVGTGDEINELVQHYITQNQKPFTLDVASNPEFLREGSAIFDFLNADRIIAGGNARAMQLIKKMYQPLIAKGVTFLGMSRRSAELTKYSANAMLACKISFINQISQLAEELDANIDDVREGIALDKRIGPHFLQAGIGYGGSCFPKDVRALVQMAKAVGVETPIFEAIDSINEAQKNWVFTRISRHFDKRLQGLTIGFWGLAFKPGTDDMREASSLVAINALIDAGADILAFDPVAMPVAKELLGDIPIVWCNTANEVLDCPLDALVIATEWPVFKNYPLQGLGEKLKGAPVFDGRNCFNLNAVKEACLPWYYSVGRPLVQNTEKMTSGEDGQALLSRETGHAR